MPPHSFARGGTKAGKDGTAVANQPCFLPMRACWAAQPPPSHACAALPCAQDKFEFDGIGSLVGPLFLAVQVGAVEGCHPDRQIRAGIARLTTDGIRLK